MKTGRLEAFSDGVLAIIITIMVLQMQVPKGGSLSDLQPVLPVFLSYILSFIYVGIYWNNHHHMFQIVDKVNGSVLWANLALLFTLSLIPFTTAWMGENPLQTMPLVLYGINLFCCALVYRIVEKVVIRFEGPDSKLSDALQSAFKEYLSVVLYIAGIVLCFFVPWLAVVCYAVVAVLWVIPDKRIEKRLQ